MASLFTGGICRCVRHVPGAPNSRFDLECALSWGPERELHMTHKILDVGAAKQIGKYSDAIETAAGLRWLHTSGTPGVSDDGTVPEGIEAQTRLAWRYILAILEKAGMTTADLVKVTTSLTDAKNIPAYAKVGSEMLGDVRPAFMLQVVTGLIRPDVLVEVEIIAAAR